MLISQRRFQFGLIKASIPIFAPGNVKAKTTIIAIMINTAGIKIDLNTKSDNTLTPDILKTGVLNNTNKLAHSYRIPMQTAGDHIFQV